MQDLKKTVITIGALAGLGMIGTVMNGESNANAGNPDKPSVSIASPIPLPVSGTVAVNNFPSAQPISGTVSVSNFPATQNVSLAPGGSVTVANTASAPVPVQNAVGGPLTHVGRRPSDYVILNFTSGGSNTYDLIGPDGTDQGAFSIPAGDVLVVTDVDWFLNPGTAGSGSLLSLSYNLGVTVFVDTALTGSDGVAGKHNALTSGIVLTQLPMAITNQNSAVLHVVLRGYVMASS